MVNYNSMLIDALEAHFQHIIQDKSELNLMLRALVGRRDRARNNILRNKILKALDDIDRKSGRSAAPQSADYIDEILNRAYSKVFLDRDAPLFLIQACRKVWEKQYADSDEQVRGGLTFMDIKDSFDLILKNYDR